ncbi:MAG: TolC family protein [Muribaculum sp.]|nr:TolC family protein [Muribaculaceae bacterium]MCM1080675.1 TolC family protein [Muribaculum sp.]
MNRTTRFLGSLCVALASFQNAGADTLSISLEDAIIRARVQSVDAAVALNELRSAYWQYRTYRADLLPEISFSAVIPGYYKQYSAHEGSDGTYSFVRNHYLEMNGELSVTQNIWLTGGKLSLNTSLDFMRQLSGNTFNRYMSIPVALTLQQPVFGVNNTKWKRKIEPVRYSEAKAQFLSASEDVAMLAIQNFFNLLMAKENMDIARQNYRNATKLYVVAKAKREMGNISENDLLQMELNLLTAKADSTSCESALKNAMFTLRSFLAFEEDVELVPIEPLSVPQTDIIYTDAIDKALENNKFAKNLRRRQLEADYNVAIAKGDLRQINLFAQIGFTGTSHEFRQAYDPLKDNQIVEVGVTIPLVDWGKRRGAVKVAESNRKVIESRLRKEMQDFNQNMFILVERFNNQKMQLDLAQRADYIAQRRYDTNVETYMIGKISTLDLNDSQLSKDQSRQKYINELFQYWYYFYQLRSLTLWDYVTNTGIDADIDRILKQ